MTTTRTTRSHDQTKTTLIAKYYPHIVYIYDISNQQKYQVFYLGYLYGFLSLALELFMLPNTLVFVYVFQS